MKASDFPKSERFVDSIIDEGFHIYVGGGGANDSQIVFNQDLMAKDLKERGHKVRPYTFAEATQNDSLEAFELEDGVYIETKADYEKAKQIYGSSYLGGLRIMHPTNKKIKMEVWYGRFAFCVFISGPGKDNFCDCENVSPRFVRKMIEEQSKETSNKVIKFDENEER